MSCALGGVVEGALITGQVNPVHAEELVPSGPMSGRRMPFGSIPPRTGWFVADIDFASCRRSGERIERPLANSGRRFRAVVLADLSVRVIGDVEVVGVKDATRGEGLPVPSLAY